MQLWTIQPFSLWEELQRKKLLRTRLEHVTASWWGRDNLLSYNWLRQQMIERIGPPPEADVYPMWAYFQWHDAKHRRPDLRSVASWSRHGSKMVLLELKVEESRVLLSDYETWQYVLNDWYLPLSEKDGEAFEAVSHSDELARTEVEELGALPRHELSCPQHLLAPRRQNDSSHVLAVAFGRCSGRSGISRARQSQELRRALTGCHPLFEICAIFRLLCWLPFAAPDAEAGTRFAVRLSLLCRFKIVPRRGIHSHGQKPRPSHPWRR